MINPDWSDVWRVTLNKDHRKWEFKRANGASGRVLALWAHFSTQMEPAPDGDGWITRAELKPDGIVAFTGMGQNDVECHTARLLPPTQVIEVGAVLMKSTGMNMK